MKRNNILIPVAALALLCAACDDDKMDWGTPDGQTPLTSSDAIPLSIQEQINNYDYLKNYVKQYQSRLGSNFILGLGMGLQGYMDDAAYRSVADGNFQMYTPGNAMKQGVMVKNDGTIDFSTVDKFLAMIPSDARVYGHNFIWHTQQNATYLKGLIAPTKVVESEGGIANILPGDDSDFEDGTKGKWGSWGNSSVTAVSEKGQGHSSDYCVVLTNPSEGSDYYVAQFAYTFDEELEVGQTYIMQFYAKADLAGASVQFQTQNSTSYAGEGYKGLEVGTDWTLVEHEYTCSKEGMNRILINFGKFATNIYIDDVKFGVKKAANKATKITYVLKSADEKKAILDNAMEQWIKGAFEHFNGDKRFAGWDVINEAIADGGGRRGINGVFGGSWTEDDVTYYDKQPTETETDGLNLNWSSAAGNQHFYWGYYMGMDYAVKAFEYSRKYADANGLTDLKLFYNDYNLETSPSKLAEVIEFVKDIDAAAGKPIVDGIGTQMHVQSGLARADIDAMFKTLAATGKLIRVTELDVAVNTASPSAAELEKQAKTYQDIFESYIENVPEAQRHGITIWTLSDAADEHEFWLNGDAPNLFTADLERKWAYKGVCDGIAGEDLGAKLSGDSWKDKNYKDRSELEAEAEAEQEEE